MRLFKFWNEKKKKKKKKISLKQQSMSLQG